MQGTQRLVKYMQPVVAGRSASSETLRAPQLSDKTATYHDRTASPSSRPTSRFPHRHNGCYVQHHGPPSRIPPRTRALRQDPRKPHSQMIDKTTNSSPSVSSPPSLPVSVTPQAVAARRSLARLLPSTLHPRTRQTSFSTSPLMFCLLEWKEQGTSATMDTDNQKTYIIQTPQSPC